MDQCHSEDNSDRQRITHDPSVKSDGNQPEQKQSRHDATLINPGPPALYQLNTERTFIEGTDGKVRRWTYGQRDTNKPNKIILLVGETGSGKTTLINTIINYSLGVKFEDQEFYQITEEPEEPTQTSEVTVYEVFIEENPTSLSIIDTPGYGDTEGLKKDQDILEYLLRLFSDVDGVHYIDSVCFVMKASQNRLSDKELYIFHSVLSLFGRDIEENTVFLLTHSDDGPPTDALNAINKAEIPCRRDEDGEPVHFLFNNRQKEKRVKRSWEMGERSMNEFFTLLDEKNRKSVQMTVDVQKERRRLEVIVCILKRGIFKEMFRTEELMIIQECLKKYKDQTLKVPTNSCATCCSVCKENCHEKCSEDDPSWCDVMKNNHCTVCTGKCHHSKHIRENKKYVKMTMEVCMAFAELRQEYERYGDRPEISFDKEKYEIKKQYERSMKFINRAIRADGLKSELKEIKNQNSTLLDEAYKIIMNLQKISLKSDSALTLQHLDFLILKLKEEGRDEWVKMMFIIQ